MKIKKPTYFIFIIVLLLNFKASANNTFSNFVVDGDGSASYTTIQEAVHAAVLTKTTQTILVRPGVYNENIDFSKATKITLLGAVAVGDEGQCEIIGTHTPPTEGTIAFRNFRFSSPKYVFDSSAPGEAHLQLIECAVSVNSGYTLHLPNWKGIIEVYNINDALGNSDGFLYNTGGAQVRAFSASIGSSKEQPMVISGTFQSQNIICNCPVTLTQNCKFAINDGIFYQGVSCQGGATGSFQFCTIRGQTLAPFTMDSSSEVEILQSIVRSTEENGLAIGGQGTGTLVLGSVIFPASQMISENLSLEYANFVAGPTSVFGDLNLSASLRMQQSESIGSFDLEKGVGEITSPNLFADSTIFLSRSGMGGSSSLGELVVLEQKEGAALVVSILPGTSRVNSEDFSKVTWVIINPYE